MSGTYVSFNGSTLTLDNGGANQGHSVAKGATVTLNGKPVKMADLQVGDSIVLTGDPVTKVVATR
jgi:hypothetical protein